MYNHTPKSRSIFLHSNPPRKSHQRAPHPSPSRQDSARNRFTVHIAPQSRGVLARPIIPVDVDVITPFQKSPGTKT
ncbi:hypothetical protein BDP55DRAFT_397321 [Colletotrichum godetiae]|uniref:Uncharacterized protein n=1 Tax=Colletotrichum godetiae TaxID=1209918 RepID=A0AAJ0A9I3_9PEZI|nr:uncharacterized protein BDP55DRAFT_397321 [Colletotrichum godetiae]KAK1658469.1 hypothetical protein BDP55DRAFT_397321 [Colletotrichum godetiae]